ncbi:MAG: hypothetical protein Q8N05_18295 [Bacteroidota bacterium]|nr:hypothetical protein [Bacteroidota bacterium]
MKTIIITILALISLSSLAQYNPVTIYTPKNTLVTAGTFSGTDWTTTEKSDKKNYWLQYYGNRISYEGEATKKYNCHAYAWYVSEGVMKFG